LSVLGVIPARFASTRFPGKPLVDLAGKSMIRRVYEQALGASRLNDVVVATDDQRILDHVESFGGKAMLTSVEHLSGTDRLCEVVDHFPLAQVIVNIQGDEPLLNPAQIDEVVSCFDIGSTELATLVKLITSESDLENSNVVKVVRNSVSEALYFSRSPIPYLRGFSPGTWLKHGRFFKHIGIYGYRRDILARIRALAPSQLERAESLEQLRWLENGLHILVRETALESQPVDVPADVDTILLLLGGEEF